MARSKEDPAAVDAYLAGLPDQPKRSGGAAAAHPIHCSRGPGTNLLWHLGDLRSQVRLGRFRRAAQSFVVPHNESRACGSHEDRDHADSQSFRSDHSLRARQPAAKVARRKDPRSARPGARDAYSHVRKHPGATRHPHQSGTEPALLPGAPQYPEATQADAAFAAKNVRSTLITSAVCSS
jgi:hypothetical protein